MKALWFPVALLSSLWSLPAQPVVQAHFHHVHLNSTDPAAAVEFYTTHFDCEKRDYQGRPAVFAQKSWLLFNKVDKAPPSDVISAIWHIGWGAEDMPATYQKELDLGAKFQTPITDISELANSPGFYYAYVDGPDHALIELNTARHHHFGHLHLFSADPVAAGGWYIDNFGATTFRKPPYPREPRFYKGFQVAPSMSLMMDNVNIIIFPIEHAKQTFPEIWKGRDQFASTQGRVIDHIAFSVDDVKNATEALKAKGIAVSADGFIDGPDGVRIELVPAGSGTMKSND
jgi:catechol 2,3-dioxygenase-like lactoylglutathione lyase family enzyme